jgi:branched-chain amino acid transport system substrate-binding protein
MNRRKLLLTFGLLAVALCTATATAATSATREQGVSARSVTIGGTFPLSGPASLYAGVGAGAAAYYAYVNDRGGVNGRTINYVTLDDGYNPAQTVQLTRRLVEQDRVFAIVGSLGTEANLATRSYLNDRKVPQVLVATGASVWGTEHKKYPWTIGFQPNYIAEAYIYGRFIVDKVPQAKIGVLYQNDAYGHDYLTGLKSGLGAQQRKIVAQEGYEVTASDVASQVAKLKASGANTFFVAATPTFAVQAVVLAYKLGWRPTIFMNSVAATNTLMGLAVKSSNADAVNGMISVGFWLDPTEPKFAKPGAAALYRSILAKYSPKANPDDAFNAYGMAQAWTFVHALQRAGKSPTRAKLMDALLNLETKANPFLLPGMQLHTTSTDHFPLDQAVLIRYRDGAFRPFGRLLTYSRVKT